MSFWECGGRHETAGLGDIYPVTSTAVKGTNIVDMEEKNMAKINKVGHVVLNVKDVDASVQFYTKALGMEVMRLREGNAAFLSFGTQHHDIALFKAPEGAEMGTLGLNHIALQIAGGERSSASCMAGSSNMGQRSTIRPITA